MSRYFLVKRQSNTARDFSNSIAIFSNRKGFADCRLIKSTDLNENGKGKVIASVRLFVEGNIDAFRQSWEGTFKWIWESTIRPHWPRKNLFVKVSFFDFQPDHSGKIKPTDLKIETCRASGLGGQHVSKTDSAVWIVHMPTDLEASANEERSYTRNHELAMLRGLRNIVSVNSPNPSLPFQVDFAISKPLFIKFSNRSVTFPDSYAVTCTVCEQ